MVKCELTILPPKKRRNPTVPGHFPDS